jgi:putative ATP-dependent endonuclease of OLD family
MYISKITVANFKSFFDPQTLHLRPGFNIVVGQNDSGKSSLMQAIGLKFDVQPHRSVKTLPSAS